jgi:hypothetical protein
MTIDDEYINKNMYVYLKSQFEDRVLFIYPLLFTSRLRVHITVL